ncbi:DUF1090 domain-containing protein [Erwinia amylovora]
MNKMKMSILPLVLVLGASFSGMASADCDIKASVLEAKIAKAEQYGNTAQVAALKKALAEVNANCTDSAKLLHAQEKVTKAEAKLEKKQAELAEAQSNLREAQADGNSKKITKYQKKVLEKQADVKEAAADLAKARATLAALQS